MRAALWTRALTIALLATWPLAIGCSSTDDGEEIVASEDEAVRDIPSREDPWIDPAAERVLVEMTEALQAAEQFSFHAETTTEEESGVGYTIEVSATSDVVVRRPGGLHLDKTTDQFHRHIYFDGQEMAFYDQDKGLFASEQNPGTVSDLIEDLHERFGSPTALSDLIVDDPRLSFSEYADHALYVGEHKVRGVLCDHIALSNDVLEWELWVQAEGPPVPRKLVIAYIDEPGVPTYRAHLSNWNLQDKTPGTVFSFTPPAGARRIRLTAANDDDQGGVDVEEAR